ncbi:MAG: hypothetical protein EBQ63_03125 [Actinobacteria bacterium]|nr:hypothetical protein [Actinomycetota bacterium]
MLNQFFVEHLPRSGQVVIDGDDGHHAVKVLRTTVGERIRICDGVVRMLKQKLFQLEKAN